jgi:hypothetical protein
MKTATATAPESTSTPALGLDELAAMSFDELEAHYRGATVPASLRPLDGALRGRMLAVRFLQGPIANVLRRFAASPGFPWGGKSFSAAGEREGSGINRVRIPSVLGAQNLFPFKTRFDRSVLDGAPAVVLDYDLPENPPYIRKIHDEVREVSPGVYLGPAMWKREGGPALVLWFALDTGRR